MIRVEAMNHNGKFDLIGIFEDSDEKRINACVNKNENYLLRKVKTGKRRRVFWTNY